MESVTMRVVRKTWELRLDNARSRERGRTEAQIVAIAERWVQRWHRRSRDTIAGPVEVDVNDRMSDYFIRNESGLRIGVRRLVDGQDHGLPAILMFDTNALEFPAVEGVYVSPTEQWEMVLAHVESGRLLTGD